MDLHWRNLDSRSAINEDPPLKSLAKSWKLSHTRDMGPCAHTQCGFLHPSLFFLPSPPLDSRSSQLTWLCQHPLQNGSAEWRARGLKGQLKATHTKVQHLQKSLSEELIRIFAVSAFFTQRERGQSQHQRQKLHFSLSHFFFFFACSSFVLFSDKWPELHKRLQTLLLQHFPLLSKKGSSTVVF